jgi:ketosteroid isomerase-like protein
VSREDVDTVRRMFDAIARRDIEATLAQLDPEVTLNVPATARLAGRTGPYRGHDGVRQYLSDVEATWSELHLEPLDYRNAADSVVIFGRVRGRRAPRAPGEAVAPASEVVPGAPAPGETFEDDVIWTWKLRDGRIVSGTAHPRN